MNSGPVEEAGRVAEGIVKGLSSTPLILALIVFNVIFIVGVYFSNQNERAYTERIMGLLIQEEADVAKMLNNCVPTGAPTGR